MKAMKKVIKKHAYTLSILVSAAVSVIGLKLNQGTVLWSGPILVIGASVLRIIYFFINKRRSPKEESFKNILIPLAIILFFISLFFYMMSYAIHVSSVAGLSLQEQYSLSREMNFYNNIFAVLFYSALGLFLYWTFWWLGEATGLNTFLNRSGKEPEDCFGNYEERKECTGCGEAKECKKATK